MKFWVRNIGMTKNRRLWLNLHFRGTSRHTQGYKLHVLQSGLLWMYGITLLKSHSVSPARCWKNSSQRGGYSNCISNLFHYFFCQPNQCRVRSFLSPSWMFVCLFFLALARIHTNSDHVSPGEALENFLRALIQIMCSLTASISRLYRWNNKANPNRRAEISPLLPSHPRWHSAKSLQSYMWNTTLRANLTKRCKNILSKSISKGRAAPFWPQMPLSFFFSLSLLLAVIYRTLRYTMYTKPGPASNLWAFVLKHCQPRLISPQHITQSQADVGSILMPSLSRS